MSALHSLPNLFNLIILLNVLHEIVVKHVFLLSIKLTFEFELN